MILHCHRFFCFETLFQLVNHRVGYDGNFIAKMNQAAHPVDISDVIQPFAQTAVDKEITRKKRLNHAHHTSASRPLQSEARVKDFQTELPYQRRRGNMLMPGLRSDAIPCGRMNRGDI